MLCGLFTSRDPVTSLLYDVIDDVVDFLQSRPTSAVYSTSGILLQNRT